MCFFVSKAAVGVYYGAHNARFFNFGLLVKFENDRKAQFVFLRTERTKFVAQFLRQHRDSSVHQINRCCPIFSFPVDNIALLHVMRYVGNMHSHFPGCGGEFSKRKGIVKIFGIFRVDGYGKHIAEIFTLGYFFFIDLYRDQIGRFLHVFGIFVRQSVLCQNGVHFGGVVARFAQHVNHFSDGIIGFFRPLHNFNHHFIAVFGSVEFIHGDKNIVCQKLAVHYQKREIFLHFQHTNKTALSTLKNLDNRSFGVGSFSFCQQLYANAVAVHGVLAVSFGNVYDVGVVVGNEEVFAVASSLETPFENQSAIIQAISSARGFQQHVIIAKPVERFYQYPAAFFSANVQRGGYLFVIELFLFVCCQEIDNQLFQLFLFRFRCRFSNGCSFTHIFQFVDIV